MASVATAGQPDSLPLASSPRLPRLPACQACSQKKRKCDNRRPSCANCSRYGLQCFVFDSVSEQSVSRSYIHHLEQRQKRSPCRSASENINGATPKSAQTAPNNATSAASLDSSSMVMNRGGLSFLSLLFSDRDWRKSNAGLLRELTEVTGQTETTHEPCPLPSESEGRSLLEQYLSWTYVLSPVLLRRELWELHSRIYEKHRGGQLPDTYDFFRIFMIYATSSVIPYRDGRHRQHPEGYYMSALRCLDSRFLARGLRSLEDLLLICRYGIYENIGTSIWDMVRLGGRLCVELKLHAHDGPHDLPAIEKQRRRRVFWNLYLFDRYCSTTLDRPFAIDDRDIRIGLPADINDHELETWNDSFQSLDCVPGPRDSSIPTDTTIFLVNVTLRRVSSRIHTEFCHLRDDSAAPSQLHLTIGRIYMALNQLLEELKAWRVSVPVIANPTCRYHTKDWHDLLYARERLYLVRRAVDLVPRRSGALLKHFSMHLLHASLEVIEQYSTMCQSSLIVHTRNYFHMMFTAGLSVIYCISSKAKFSHQDLLLSAQGLRACEATLTDMGIKMQHSHPYATVFAALHRDVSHEIQQALQDSIESSRPGTTPSSPNINPLAQPATASTQSIPGHSNSLPAMQVLPESHRMPYESRYPPQPGPSRDFHTAGLYPATNQLGESSNIPPPFHSEIFSTMGSNDLIEAGNNLPQWEFADNMSLWNIDNVLWEYVYGDPDSSVSMTNAFSGGF